MSASPAKLCDGSLDLAEAVRYARVWQKEEPGFELAMSRYLQMQCLSSHVRLPWVIRGMEVLAAVTEEERLFTLLRPFLRSADPQIASKAVLLLGRCSHRMNWMTKVMTEVDDRVRANLVEALWGRREPEIEALLQNAAADSHHRVAANAIYGLFLLGLGSYIEPLRILAASQDPLRRRSAIWVIRSIREPEATALLRGLIRDSSDMVRHAAFEAVKHLREKAAAAPA